MPFDLNSSFTNIWGSLETDTTECKKNCFYFFFLSLAGLVACGSS